MRLIPWTIECHTFIERRASSIQCVMARSAEFTQCNVINNKLNVYVSHCHCFHLALYAIANGHSGLVVSLKYDLLLLGMYFGSFSSIQSSSSSSFETYFFAVSRTNVFIAALRMQCNSVVLFVRAILKWKMVNTFLTREFWIFFFLLLICRVYSENENTESTAANRLVKS